MVLRLETPRLLLRPFDERDAEAFAAYRSDAEVARYQGWQAPYSLQQAQQFVAEMKTGIPGQPGRWYQLAFEHKSGGELIGDCGFYLFSEDRRQAEIGVTLAQAYQGQGYAFEGLSCLLDYLFGQLQLHRVRANIDPENEASARVLSRLGMRYEGRFVDSLWFKGRWASEDWYAILEREWKELHSQPSGRAKI